MIQFIQDPYDRKWFAFVWDVHDHPFMIAAAVLKQNVAPRSVKFLLVIPQSSPAWPSVTTLPGAMQLFIPGFVLTEEPTGMLIGSGLQTVATRRNQLFALRKRIVGKFDESADKVIRTLGQG